MKKLLLLLLASLALSSNGFAQLSEYRHGHIDAAFAKTYDPRSDTVDILNYTINLRITDFTNGIIAGNTEVKFRAKQNGVQYIQLDLLDLTVDSVVQNGIRINHTYVNPKINLKLTSVLSVGDSTVVKVYYRGTPSGDVTGWGGFYFQNGFAYNLGVGFGAEPHNYGRVWFPCFDNFMERSTYKFNITTNNGKIAYCNGILKKDTLNGDGSRTRTWELKEQIPSYLASVAVGNYVDYQKNYNGIEKNIPILMAILPGDSANADLNLQVLNNAMAAYEQRFGPYQWNRVGYALVPFNQGAMEHATNIAYPRSFFGSLQTYSSILVHELSHHWFGNLITCSSQEEMWLNEGWASYCEHIYTEATRGKAAYTSAIKALHQPILQLSSYKEGNINLNAIPHAYTYGDHVYLKGALMAHNLRAYMGDSLFFASLKTVLAQNAYKSITNDEFIAGLSAASGINLQHYLNDWIKQPGWADFRIDSNKYEFVNNKHVVEVFINQKKFNNANLFQEVPLEISFINKQHQVYTTQIKVSGLNSSFVLESPFKPDMIVLNMNDKLCFATASDQKKITAAGNYNFVLAKMNVDVLSNTDSSMLRIENHYTGAGGNFPAHVNRISTQRYWMVDGMLSVNFKARARFSFDGRTGAYTGNYYLDHKLNIVHEDSVLLMYRKNSSEDWVEFPYYTLETGPGKTNKYGNITIDSLWLGEYCLGIGKSLKVGQSLNKKEKSSLLLFPNPSKEEIFISIKNNSAENVVYEIEIFDVKGQLIFSEKNIDLTETHKIITKHFTNGTYALKLKSENKIIDVQKFNIE